MPNPHFRVEFIARSKGQSVVAAAAYRSGEVLNDDRAGKTFDYSRKEDVIHAEIMTPLGAPSWTSDRAILWNKVEASEKRKDAQLARNIIAALPRELDHKQNLALVRGYIQDNFTSKGMIADFAIHESDAGDGFKNPHAHILLTLRPLEGGEFGKKNRHWNQKNTLNSWRHSWEAHTNQHLEVAGRMERVSLKSYKQQGKNKMPQLHLGEEMGNLEKRGVETKKGDYNRKVRHENTVNEILSLENDGFDLHIDGESQDAETHQPKNPREKGQFQHRSNFLDADPAMRLEAMTLELKDDMDEYADQKSENESQQSGINGKEGVLGAFRKQDQDSEDLAVASLEASKALNEAAIRDYLQLLPQQTPKEQLLEKVRQAEYARLTAEKQKAPGQRAMRQFDKLLRETEQTRPKERSDDLER